MEIQSEHSGSINKQQYDWGEHRGDKTEDGSNYPDESINAVSDTSYGLLSCGQWSMEFDLVWENIGKG